jgi:gamma-glutamylputrescine oxidase
LLLRGLVRCIHERQGKIYEATQVIDISKSHPATLRLADGGTIIADEVVLATSGYTAGLGVFCGRILPVHLRVLVTEPLGPAAFQVLGWMGREGIIDSRRIFNYFRLTEDNRIVFGGGVPRYRWGGHTDDDPGASTYLDQLVAEVHRTFLPEAEVQVVSGWTGMIGYVLDAMPVIQRLPDRQTVVHVGGWCGHGIALSVASGAWVAHLIHHGQPPEALPWFRDNPPIVPCELIRWCSFRAVVGMMSLIDRL